METGFYFALLTAATFAIAQVIIRRITYQSGESSTGVITSVLIGVPLFPVVVTLTGQWPDFLAFTWVEYVLLASAGLVHLIVARFLFFNATRIIGANSTAAISRTAIVFSVIFGVIFLDEIITPWIIIGALVIMFGAILTSLGVNIGKFRFSTGGIAMAFGTAIASASSALLIRPVMQSTDSIFAAACVMYLAAFAGILLLLVSAPGLRRKLDFKERSNMLLLSANALLLAAGHIFRFKTLVSTPISIAQPLIASMVVFVLLFSWIANRKIDVFNWRILVGILLVLSGVVVLYL